MALENPFTPTFGEIPAHLAGRKTIIARTDEAFASQKRRPELTTLFSGARGTGKTTLLSLIADRASQNGWVVASVTAMPGMLEDIEIRSRKAAAHLMEGSEKVRVASVGIPQIVELSFERGDERDNWRSRIEQVLDVLDEFGTGLLITVDEVDASLDEMIQLAAVYQHFVREGRKVALLMAGLPSNVSSLVSNKTVSFLRRAEMMPLGRIDDFDIEEAFRKTIEESGRTISAADLAKATEAIAGFPFMMQLIGFRAWEEHPEEKAISAQDVRNGIDIARKEMRARIFESTYRELSDADIAFLEAMLVDDADSRIGDVTQRLGWSSSQVSQYRRRLIDAGVIGERRRGVVGFDMPFFREYLEEL